MISLENMQRTMMEAFYAEKPRKVVYNKAERDALWRKAKYRYSYHDIDFDSLFKVCPALAFQIQKSFEKKSNIQSAVFSECAYAQTLANMFGLTDFADCSEKSGFFSDDVSRILFEHHLSPRYAYSNAEKSVILIQAGGHSGVDCALISTSDLSICTIEFKEPGAKTSEPDLPKYGENGVLLVNEPFLKKYPQFEEMLKEQKGLNFFDKMGNNIHDFSPESIRLAVSENYTKKYADVICTEDVDGYLTMMPANNVHLWAKCEGEIRPAGRNHYCVWTPKALRCFLAKKNAVIRGDWVTINRSTLTGGKARGGDDAISRYKINPLFFVYAKDCVEENGSVRFSLKKVRQLNPTIAGKMFFLNLHYSDVKKDCFGG